MDILLIILIIIIVILTLGVEIDFQYITVLSDFKDWIFRISKAEQMYKLSNKSKKTLNQEKVQWEIRYIMDNIQKAANNIEYEYETCNLYPETVKYLKKEGFQITTKDELIKTNYREPFKRYIISWSEPGKKKGAKNKCGTKINQE